MKCDPPGLRGMTATAVRELAQETQRRADDAIRHAARDLELEDVTR